MPDMEVDYRLADRTLYRKLLELARPYTGLLIFLLVLDLLDALVVIVTPLPLKIAIDSVLGSRPLPSLVRPFLPDGTSDSTTSLLQFAVGLVLVVALMGCLQTMISAILRAWVGEKLLLEFRSRLFRHAQGLSLAYHDVRGTADTHYRIQKDAASIQDLLIDGALPLAGAALTVLFMFSVTVWIDWQLGLIAALVAPVLLFLSIRFKRRLRHRAREVKKLESAALGVVQEVLAALRVVKAFRQEGRESDRFQLHAQNGMTARLRLQFAESFYGVAIRITTALGTAAVLYVGVRHVQDGVLTLGGLVLVLGYLAKMYDPLKTISRKAGGLQTHLASAERAFALLSERPEVDHSSSAIRLTRARGDLEFRDVAFAYGSREEVLQGISFRVAAGERLGLVGTTGAGKTTLLSLLTRLYDPSNGAIFLDGRDIRDYQLADLRNQFTPVLQDSILFSASIAENIAYGRPGASQAEIERAARAACAHDFITRLPAGYDTCVGERGMCLSGGERQRLAIARAFLKDAPILLMDEPTSAVDVKTENEILESMERLMRGRTCIIISHRATPLAVCDRVVTMAHGRLVDPAASELITSIE
jgi:ATP-binding cassette subfamily B protein